jgi:hypothetical protein
VALSRLRAGHDGRAVQRAVDALQEASRPPHSSFGRHSASIWAVFSQRLVSALGKSIDRPCALMQLPDLKLMPLLIDG